MPILTLDEFVAMREGDRSPMLDFYWYCVSLPFGLDPSYVETVSLPFPSINAKPLYVASSQDIFPGFLETAAFDITFYEDVSLRTRKWIKEWQERIRNPSDGTYFLPGNYKRDLVFALTDGTKADVPVMTVTLKDCWPTTTSPMELTNAGGQAIKVQQNFSIDEVHWK